MLGRTRSLLAKFLILVVPIVIVCSLAASGLSTYLNAKDLQRQLGQEMMNVAATQGVALAVPLWNYRTDNTQQIVDAILVNPNISRVQVTDNFQTVVAVGAKAAGGGTSWSIAVPILSPVSGDAAYIGKLRLTYDDEQIRRTVRERLLSDAVLLGALILAVSVGAALAHALVIGRPLAGFVRAIRRAEDPTLRQPVPVATRDEIGNIMEAYNRLLHRLAEEEAEVRRASDALRVERDRAEDALAELKAAQESLIQAEKLAALGALVAGMAHEMNTPIGNALVAATFLADETVAMEETFAAGTLRAQTLRDYLASARQTAAHVVEGCARAAGLVRSFKMVAADSAEQDRSVLPASGVVDLALTGLPPRAIARHRIAVDCEDGLLLDTYSVLLAGVISALVRNAAVHGFAEGVSGRIAVAIRALPGDRVEVSVADDGRGIAAAVVPRIFDPFFTTDRRAGAGIGLHFVHNAVTRTLGGQIEVETAEGQGARFRVILPRVAP